MTKEGRIARIGLAAVTVAGAVGLAAAGSSGSAGAGSVGGSSAQPANEAPVAALRLRHRRVRAGRKLLLDSSRSRDGDGRIVQHLWDLDGDGRFERRTGRHARIRHAFRRPGRHLVAVVVVDDSGAYGTRSAHLRVVANGKRAEHATQRIRDDKRRGRARVHAAARVANGGDASAVKVTRAKTAAASPPVHASSTTDAVSIKNYKYVPKSISITVGDTVTWTNQDDVGHTATADDGTFDTGLMSKGTSQSYTFNKAGKFTYHCTPHASFMKGASVTVKSSSSSSGGGGNSLSGDSSNSNSSAGESSSGGGSSSDGSSSLPHTGLEIGGVILAGLALLGSGIALRRRLTRG